MFAIYIRSYTSLFLLSLSFFSFPWAKPKHTPASLFVREAGAIKANRPQGIAFRTRVVFGPVESGVGVVEEDPRELLVMGPLEMLRHGRAVGPPTSVTVLPLPHDHRVSMLLPLGAHPPARRPAASTPARTAALLRALPEEFHTHARHTLAARRQRGNIFEFSHGHRDGRRRPRLVVAIRKSVSRFALSPLSAPLSRRSRLDAPLPRSRNENTPWKSGTALARERDGEGKRSARTSTRGRCGPRTEEVSRPTREMLRQMRGFDRSTREISGLRGRSRFDRSKSKELESSREERPGEGGR